jgi:2-haloacid dehalogenase
MNFSRIAALTFDCFGTLIDWETGILRAVKPVLTVHGVRPDDADLLVTYAELEAAEEAGEYKSYREVLRGVMRGIGERYGVGFESKELDRLPDSLSRWPAFPDTAKAMEAMAGRFRLGIISNVDEDLFEKTMPKLGALPERVVTAELCRSYKPSLRNFKVMVSLLDISPEQVLHVAQSRFHDIAPAKRMGMHTCWVNRASILKDRGITPSTPADSEPELEVPDLASLVRAMELA